MTKTMHCDLCLDSFSWKSDLAKHYSKIHFAIELEAAFSEYFTENNFCTICMIQFENVKEEKLEHVGQKHKKVFYVMKEKGLDVVDLFRENRERKQALEEHKFLKELFTETFPTGVTLDRYKN